MKREYRTDEAHLQALLESGYTVKLQILPTVCLKEKSSSKKIAFELWTAKIKFPNLTGKAREKQKIPSLAIGFRSTGL